jgi:electron transport complex protein RnfB
MSEKAVVDINTCSGCGVCVDSCPTQAIEMADNVAKVDPAKCTGDKACVDACPVQAISMK